MSVEVSSVVTNTLIGATSSQDLMTSSSDTVTSDFMTSVVESSKNGFPTTVTTEISGHLDDVSSVTSQSTTSSGDHVTWTTDESSSLS